MRSTALFLFAASTLALVSVPRGASAQTNEVGLNAHDGEPAVMAMASGLDIGWVRLDANWFQMEPRRGDYRWINDDAVRDATSRGIQVLMSFAYTPEWVPRVAGSRSDDGSGNDEPVSSNEWVDFVEAAVRHYRALGVTHFGVWNEPNLDHFFEGNVDAYVDKLLIPGAEAIRRTCGDCLVVGPDLAHVGDYHLWLEPIMRRAGGRFDIVAHHLYNGFPELGTTVFSGDNFLQALESRRFSFTRPAMREVLDAAGWTGEVWITETGYRAGRIGDVGDEADQATYVRLVLEEQLARPWWTNTFFYEAQDCGIDIPDCDIDGFGLARPNHSRPRAFPGDYRTKPAYDTLRDFIASHPSIGPVGSTPPGPGPDAGSTLEVPHHDGVVVDGQTGDWIDVTPIAITTWDGDGDPPSGDDHRAEARIAYREGELFVAVTVTDDVHDNENDVAALWAGDSLQVAFDTLGDGGEGYGADDHEFTVALSGGEARIARETGTGEPPAYAVRRDGSQTHYELALGAASLPRAALLAGETLGFSLVVNEADGAGREGWLELTPGIARGKTPALFATLHFLEPGAEPTPGGPGTRDSGAGSADGGSGGPGTGTDGGAGPMTPGSPGSPSAPTAGAGGCAISSTEAPAGSPTGAALACIAALLAGGRRRRSPRPRR